jgi:hypothetical protein
MRREASTRREKKPLKLNVSQQTLDYMVAIKQREGHPGLSQTLDYLLECDRGRFLEDRGGLPLLNTY